MKLNQMSTRITNNNNILISMIKKIVNDDDAQEVAPHQEEGQLDPLTQPEATNLFEEFKATQSSDMNGRDKNILVESYEVKHQNKGTLLKVTRL